MVSVGCQGLWSAVVLVICSMCQGEPPALTLSLRPQQLVEWCSCPSWRGKLRSGWPQLWPLLVQLSVRVCIQEESDSRLCALAVTLGPPHRRELAGMEHSREEWGLGTILGCKGHRWFSMSSRWVSPRWQRPSLWQWAGKVPRASSDCNSLSQPQGSFQQRAVLC